MNHPNSMKRLLAGIVVLVTSWPVQALPLSKASASGKEVWLLNCGAGFDYTDPQQNWWTHDEIFDDLARWGFVNGQAAIPISRPIAGTDLDPLYQTHHFGGTDMVYQIAVPRGRYRITLHFAETFWTARDQRVFDVAIENETVLADHDIFAEKGFDRADTHTFTREVTDGALTISFPRITADNALLCGLEVEVVSLSDDDFLDFVQRSLFRYFETESDPVTGIVKENENSFAGRYSSLGNIAATGFGMSALTVAVSRGWMAPADARNRIMATLTLFDSLQQVTTDPNQSFHGFWNHFVHMDTGFRSGTSEISNIDSAIFMAGAIQAGEYFRNTYPEIKSLAETLHSRMEWTFWLNRHPDVNHPDNLFMCQGWNQSGGAYPNPGEGGYFAQDYWNRYSETVLIDLLALGSTSFPLPVSAWTQMRRTWVNDHGYNFIHEPPLFTQQFQNLYFDLGSRHDGWANYKLTARDATLYNRALCEEDTFLYEKNRWGVTASYGPPGYCAPANTHYWAYGVPPFGCNDGTVAPTAALTSMELTPGPSIAAARFMYFQYKHHIWGRFGFTDSFNVTRPSDNPYIAPITLGLDTGPIILGIENHRTGMIKETFMKSPIALRGLAAAGFIPYDTPLAISSSRQDLAPLAVDGNPATRWAAADLPDPQFIGIDFGQSRPINRLVLVWEAAYAKAYTVQISNDRLQWADIDSVENGNGGRDVVAIPTSQTRFVRILCRQRGSPFPYSLWEISAFYDSGAPPEGTSGVAATATVTE